MDDPKFKNWVKSGLSLKYTKDGIEHFVDKYIGNLHQYILKKLPHGVTCTNCTTANIIKCEPNNSFCKFAKRVCLVHDQRNVHTTYKRCPMCDQIRDEIIANHRYGKPNWQNTDARQWCTNKWEIAVCYMPSGYRMKASAGETDISGLLNVVINNTYFQAYVEEDLSELSNIFLKARNCRNSILHNANMQLTDVELEDLIVIFTELLSDVKCLSTDQNALAAKLKLTKIKDLQLQTSSLEKEMVELKEIVKTRDRDKTKEELEAEHVKQISAKNISKQKGQESIDLDILLDDLKVENNIENCFYTIETKVTKYRREGDTTLKIVEENSKIITNMTTKERKQVTDNTEKEEGETFEGGVGGIKRSIFVDKCVYDGRLLTLKKGFTDNITKGKPKEVGGYGKVFECGMVKELEMKCVLKKIDYNDNENNKQSAGNEIIAARVMHWAIAPVIGIFEEPNKWSCFLLPLLEKGNLHHAIEVDRKKTSNEKLMNWQTRLKILYQIASAIEYIHTKVKGFRGSLIHRDISSKNIVLDEAFNGRLIDFGIMHEFEESQTKRHLNTATRCYGTVAYQRQTVQTNLTKDMDWFSFGVVILEMLTSKEPIETYFGKLESLKDHKKNSVEEILMENDHDIENVWGKNDAVTTKVTDVALKCLNSHQNANFEGGEFVECLKKLVRTEGDNIKYSQSSEQKKRCDYCMVNPTKNNITDHTPQCNMYICVACLRNSYLNPIRCHTCGENIVTPVGTTWGGILIAGYADDQDDAHAFKEEIEKIQQVITSKHPMVVGMNKDNVHVIQPPIETPKLNEQENAFNKAFKDLEAKMKLDDKKVDTVIIYYSGHYFEKEGFKLGKDEMITKEELKSNIKTLMDKQEKDKTIFVFLDCCNAPDLTYTSTYESSDRGESIIQISASGHSESTVKVGEWSIFTHLFIKALVGKTQDKQLKQQTKKICEPNCSICEHFERECEDGFITFYKLYSYIAQHLKDLGYNEPACNSKVQKLKTIYFSYYVDKPTHIECSVQLEDTNIGKKMKIETVKGLQVSSLQKIFKKLVQDDSMLDESLQENYFDIVGVYEQTGPMSVNMKELFTIEQIVYAWISKRPIVAKLRNLDNISNGRVAIHGNDINAECILEKYLKYENTQQFCVLQKEPTAMILNNMREIENVLKKLQKSDDYSTCNNLQRLIKLSSKLRHMSKLNSIILAHNNMKKKQEQTKESEHDSSALLVTHYPSQNKQQQFEQQTPDSFQEFTNNVLPLGMTDETLWPECTRGIKPRSHQKKPNTQDAITNINTLPQHTSMSDPIVIDVQTSEGNYVCNKSKNRVARPTLSSIQKETSATPSLSLNEYFDLPETALPQCAKANANPRPKSTDTKGTLHSDSSKGRGGNQERTRAKITNRNIGKTNVRIELCSKNNNAVESNNGTSNSECGQIETDEELSHATSKLQENPNKEETIRNCCQATGMSTFKPHFGVRNDQMQQSVDSLFYNSRQGPVHILEVQRLLPTLEITFHCPS